MNCGNCKLHVIKEDCECLEKRVEHAFCCKNMVGEYIGSCMYCLSIE